MGISKTFRPYSAADKIQIEVVAYGKGLSLLLKTNTAYEERMKKAIASGVVLAACQNMMRLPFSRLRPKLIRACLS